MYAEQRVGELAGNRKTRDVCGRTFYDGWSRKSADDRKTSQQGEARTALRCRSVSPLIFEFGNLHLIVTLCLSEGSDCHGTKNKTK